jgi:hypothetical protein
LTHPTKIRQELADQLSSFRGRPELAPFWAHFERVGLSPVHDMDAFDAACREEDGALDLMVAALSALESFQLRTELVHDEPICCVAPALMLAAAEHYLLSQSGWQGSVESRVVVHLEDVMAAAMAAAVAHNTGLRLVRSDLDDQRCEVANLVAATDISSLGFTTVKDQAVAALIAARDAGFGPDRRPQREQALARIHEQGVPGPDALRAELRALARTEKIQLMVMLQPGPEGEVNTDLIRFLQEDCRVPTWVHQHAQLEPADRARLRELQGTLLRYVQGLYRALNPQATVPRSVASSRPLVFVSYAHKDDVEMQPLNRSPVWVLLAGLQSHHKNGGAFDFFFDRVDLRTGDDWEGKIRRALDDCCIAIVMLSSDFFASDFVSDIELKVLRERHQLGAVKVLPLKVRPCTIPAGENTHWLEPLQRADGMPLIGLKSEFEAEKVLQSLVDDALEHCRRLPAART